MSFFSFFFTLFIAPPPTCLGVAEQSMGMSVRTGTKSCFMLDNHEEQRMPHCLIIDPYFYPGSSMLDRLPACVKHGYPFSMAVLVTLPIDSNSSAKCKHRMLSLHRPPEDDESSSATDNDTPYFDKSSFFLEYNHEDNTIQDSVVTKYKVGPSFQLKKNGRVPRQVIVMALANLLHPAIKAPLVRSSFLSTMAAGPYCRLPLSPEFCYSFAHYLNEIIKKAFNDLPESDVKRLCFWYFDKKRLGDLLLPRKRKKDPAGTS